MLKANCAALVLAIVTALSCGCAPAVEKLSDHEVVLDAQGRLAMAQAEMAHLTAVMAGSLSNAYWLATGFAGLTLVILIWTPARLRGPD